MASDAKNDDSDDDDEPILTRKRTTKRNRLPIISKDVESDEESADESEDCPDDDSSHSHSSSILSATTATPVTQNGPSTLPTSQNIAKKGPTWRYEQAKEARLREQRRKEWNVRRANLSAGKGKAPNRKMKKLLAELEDSEEFAEAQGYKVEGSMDDDSDGDFVPKRPVRKGARKNYAGQE